MRRSARNGEMNDTMHDESRVHHETRHFGDAPDVLHAIGIGEAEVLVEAVAHVVAIEHVGMPSEREQAPLDEIRDRRLAGAREAREPQDACALALELRTRALVDVERLPVNVVRPAQCEMDEAGAQGVVASAGR